MSKLTKIVIAGPRGRMGLEAVKMVTGVENFQLVGVIDRINEGKNLSDVLSSVTDNNSKVYTDIAVCLQDTKPDVLIDLTVPEAAFQHAKTALNYGVRPIIGTTGMSQAELEELKMLAKDKQLGCIIAPNFAIGAVLMMKFSQMAAKYFTDVEIIEMHHDNKLDAPSGTAIKTAEMIQVQREAKKQGHPNEVEKLQGARGAEFDGMHIHSVRLPGLIAHQQVLFGSTGESLTIRHDSYDRASFMTGVKVSVETVMKLNEYVYGLENILD
ncbi:4-hydroxy-tetrahydrodipicolinate reductase [Caldibacillus lycopersici]|uniref:4-hydroxy-tetrahydrodipicolinate reductase n=1 Tax=Perspicuibacillus lycopersici TaxID=1325689 RepID=A0AAE3LNB8_9BACI|nr:4-hydroxy-tetrahydrodipicolinate reductase [Perspicuibacillus lycopersici]MCU9613692.1 4-hydroxy-tetrahydrodipicolinate reductase [Perspicuibacillus lycopersici]